MSELRQDVFKGRWVVIATERARRPNDFTQPPREKPQPNGSCPFCAGNENKTPQEVLAYRDEGSTPNGPGWQLRVVPNLYPAFAPGRDGHRPRRTGLYAQIEGVGAHEVVISSPDHSTQLGSAPLADVRLVLHAYRERVQALSKLSMVKYIHTIINHGKEAGASLEHPHSQIFALPLVPELVQRELDTAARYFADHGHCAYCDLIRQELECGDRVVLENDHFVAIAPFAPTSPFETWLLPKRHGHRFEEITDEELWSFAQVLKEALARLEVGLNDPPFNYFIHTAPVRREAPSFHWHLEILPKLATFGGLELGAGIYINTIPPEAAATYLSQVQLPWEGGDG